MELRWPPELSEDGVGLGVQTWGHGLEKDTRSVSEERAQGAGPLRGSMGEKAGRVGKGVDLATRSFRKTHSLPLGAFRCPPKLPLLAEPLNLPLLRAASGRSSREA